MQIRTILGILFVVLILQAVFSLFQIRQIYQTMEQQKQLYRERLYSCHRKLPLFSAFPVKGRYYDPCCEPRSDHTGLSFTGRVFCSFPNETNA